MNDKQDLPACVVNSAAYDRDGKRRDIGLDEADKYELRALLQARIGRH